MKKANRILTILIFVFLYIPMAVLIVASFNTGKDITQFEGFTLNQYVELFRDKDLLGLLGNSILIALLSTAFSVAFGTLAALGIHSLKPKMTISTGIIQVAVYQVQGQATSTHVYTTNSTIHVSALEFGVLVTFFVGKILSVLQHTGIRPVIIYLTSYPNTGTQLVVIIFQITGIIRIAVTNLTSNLYSVLFLFQISYAHA